MNQKPWEVHPALTNDRLSHIGHVIKKVRNKALELYDPSEGDGPWGLGCRVYERTINVLEKETENLRWLGCIRDGLYFVMLIDGIPVRFYKGEIENPNFRSLRRRYPEIEAHQCVFPFDQSQWFWRLVVETDEIGEVFRILIAQYTENGNFKNPWEIPVMDTVPIAEFLSSSQRESVMLDSPPVALREKNIAEVPKNE